MLLLSKIISSEDLFSFPLQAQKLLQESIGTNIISDVSLNGLVSSVGDVDVETKAARNHVHLDSIEKYK